MNYFRCGGSEKVTIDGVKVKDKMELVSQNVDMLLLGDSNKYSFGGSPAATIFDGNLYLLLNKSLIRWDGNTEWNEVVVVPSDYEAAYMATLNDEIHLFTLHGHLKWDGNTFTQLSITDSRGVHIVFNGEMYWLKSSSSDNFFKYNSGNNTWTQLPDIIYGGSSNITSNGVVVYDNAIYITYGYDSNNSHFTYIAKWDGTTWTELYNSSTSIFHYKGGYMAVKDNKLYIFDSFNRIYDPNNPSSTITKCWRWKDGNASGGSYFEYVGTAVYADESSARLGGLYLSRIVTYKDEIHIIGGGSSSYFTDVRKRHYIFKAKVYR